MMARRLPPRLSMVLGLLALPALTGCVKVPSLEDALAEAQAIAQTTKVYAADGSLITELHAEEHRELIPLEEVPPHVRDAVLAIEDARFYQHAGVDYLAVVRALARNVEEGRVVEGGSTITQQLVKNTLVERERTFQRKMREAVLAYQLEQQLSKDEILERYLNTVYFGRGAYGIEAAAQTYFSKAARDLTLVEGALLAGLIRSPSRYDPSEDKVARGRRNIVLTRMRDEAMISEDEYDKARRRPIALRPKELFGKYPYAHFVELVKERIFDGAKEFRALGETRAERINSVFKGGLRIHTTIDPRLQRAAERAVKQTLPYRSDPRTAFAAVNPHNGHIVAMVGGRNFFARKDRYAKVNLAVRKRQPGSSFKPFTLVAALEKGIPLSRVFAGGRRAYLRLPTGETWNPGNYEGIAFGSMSLKRATAYSVNVIYARVIMEVGPKKVVEVARRMGIESKLDPVYAISLGSEEVSPLEMASAYSTFATGGIRQPSSPIAKITDAEGKVIWEFKPKRKRVLAEPVAALAVDALQEVMRSGTGRSLQFGRPAGGKTGTSEEYADAWYAGFTPDMVAVSWVGFPQARIAMRPPRTRRVVFGSSWPGQMWRQFMIEAHRGLPEKGFPKPPGDLFVRVKVDSSRGCLPNAFTPPFLIKEQQFLRGSEPKEVCTEPKSGEISSTPNVVGKRAGDARSILLRAGFAVVSVSQYCPAFVEGTVCDQDPPPGSGSNVGARATIYVSNDTAVSEVPMVLGRTIERARQKLRDYGYKVRVIEAENREGVSGCRQSSETDRDRVWAQNPCAGANFGRGSVVTIYANP